MILPQHAAGRLIDGHDVALLVKEKNSFFKIVEKLSQAGQGNHKPFTFRSSVNCERNVNV